MIRDQKGFNLIVVAAIIVVVALVWVIGISILKKDDSSVPKPKVNSSVKKQVTNESTGYITITEWGVKIPITDTLTDVTYEIDTDITGDNGFGIAEFTTKQISADNPDCKIIYTITRSSQEPLVKEDGSSEVISSEALPLGVYLGEIEKLYYIGMASSEECLAENKNQEQQTVTVLALDRAVQGLAKN